jgi:hypothetical protein
MKEEEFIEECWFIYGVRIKNYFFGFHIYHSAGSAGHVEFDWEKAMHPRLLGWIHTHPSGFGPRPSEMDNSVMRGWIRGLNRPMICGIFCDNDKEWYDYYRARPKGEIAYRKLAVEYTSKFVWGKYEIC